MPSPFPGMDPFLEAPNLFPGFHGSLITFLQENLQPRLPETYFAQTEERVWVEVTRRFIEPDVQVHQKNGGITPPEMSGGGGVALLVAAEPVVVTVPHDEHRESFLEIYADKGEGIRLVTAIEVLSPSNKAPGEQGRNLFLRKQQEILNSKTHLVEIDLLRGGQHTTAVSLDWAREKTGPFDYHVCCHRYDCWEDYLVYPIRLAQRLPVIAIPLLPGDPDVAIDLQSVFDRCYEVGPYRRRIRYGESKPIPPLNPDQEEWMQQLFKAKGLVS